MVKAADSSFLSSPAAQGVGRFDSKQNDCRFGKPQNREAPSKWWLSLLFLLLAHALVHAAPDPANAVYDDSNPAPLFQEYMTAATMPKLLVDVKTECPYKARAMRFEGVVETYAWLTKRGDVAFVRLAPGTRTHELLNEAATAAAAKRKYSPALNARGRPVNIWVRQVDSFFIHPHCDTSFPPVEPSRPRSGSTLLETIGQLWPGSNDLVRVNEHAAVYCGDGVFWIIWAYEFGSYAYAVHGSVVDKIGLYCKCVGIDGRVIVPPMRIAAPTWNGYNYLFNFTALALPDGGVLVLTPLPLHQDGTHSLTPRADVWPSGIVKTITPGGRCMTVSSVPREGRTAVIAVDRKSRVRRMVIDGGISARVSWSDSAGHFFFIHRSPTGTVRYFELPPTEDPLRPTATDTLARDTASAKKPARFLKERRVSAARQASARVDGHFALVQMHDGRLLAARAPAMRGVFGFQYATDTVVVYQLRAHDLSVLDSTRFWARLVAGNDFPGATIPQPVLESTATGYAFFIQSRFGVKSFWLERNGRPQLGERVPARVGTVTDFKNSTAQLISGGHWYGFTHTGQLCHDPPLAVKPHVPPEWMEPNDK